MLPKILQKIEESLGRLRFAIQVSALIVSSAVRRSIKDFDNVTIFGNHRFTEACISALRVLKEKAPETFQIINTQVESITQAPGSGILHTKPAVIFLNINTASLPTEELAGVFAHEGYHTIIKGENLSQSEEERRCIEYECKVLEKLGVEQRIIENAWKSLETEYWKVPIYKRWW